MTFLKKVMIFASPEQKNNYVDKSYALVKLN